MDNSLLTKTNQLIAEQATLPIEVLPVLITYEIASLIEQADESISVSACTCSASCGSNYSKNGNCVCSSSCGSNYSR